MSATPNERISDYTQCPSCVAENDQLGGGFGYADHYFNHDGVLWAVCSAHQVRWSVTRELLGIPHDASLAALPKVEGVYRLRRSTP